MLVSIVSAKLFIFLRRPLTLLDFRISDSQIGHCQHSECFRTTLCKPLYETCICAQSVWYIQKLQIFMEIVVNLCRSRVSSIGTGREKQSLGTCNIGEHPNVATQ